MKKIYLIIFIALGLSLNAQLEVADTLSVNDLVQTLAGPGLTITNVTINCPQEASGQFFGDNTNLGLSEGVLLTTGSIFNAQGPNTSGSQATLNGAPGDADLNPLTTAPTEDACSVEFDLETIGDSLRFNYVFGSEEYLEFVNLGFNDVFAFFISGPGIVGQQNIALIPGTNTPVTIDNVNNVQNNAYYVVNGTGANGPFNTGAQYIQYDGFTVPLQAVVSGLTPCSVYHLKLAIADAGDDSYDSGVFLEAGSFTSNAVAIAAASVVDPNFNFAVEGCVNGEFIFTLPQTLPSDFTVNFSVGGTATQGLDYSTLPTSIVIPAGSLSASLTVTVLADAILENLETLVLYLNSPCGVLPYDSATLDIFDPNAYPILFQIDNFTGCVGSDATITAISPGYSNYQWSPATYLNTTLGPVVEASNVTSDVSYLVSATLGTCVVSDNVSLDVSPLYASLLPQLDTSCTNGSVSITANYSPSTANIVSYSWSPAALIADPSLQTIVAFPQSTTDFIVEMTSDLGCTVTDTITVQVLQGGPRVEVTPSDTLICPGQSVDLSVEVFEECLLILQEFDSFGDGWNGSQVQLIQNGVVLGTLTLEAGASGADSITVLQGVPTQINFIAGSFLNETSYNLTYSDGTSIFSAGPFPGTGIVNTFTPSCGLPSPVYTYTWLAGDGLSSASGQTVVATPSATSNYIVNAEGGTCTGTGFARIRVDAPAFEAIGDTICSGDLAQLDLTQTGVLYNSCEYSLTLDSDFGWFGSSADVLLDGVLLGSFSNTSANAASFDLNVSNLSTLEIFFNPPTFDNGEQIILQDASNVQIFSNNNLNGGLVYTTTVNCPVSTVPTSSCEYTINMFDSFGDGWNGASLTVNADGAPIGTFAAAGSGSSGTFEVVPGTVITLNYTSGAFENENSYNLLDPSGANMFSAGPSPSTGLVFTTTANSVGCTVVQPDINFIWQPGLFLSDSTISNPQAGPATTTDFYLSYTYGYSGCSFVDTTTVVVIDPNVYTLTQDTDVCAGSSVQLAFSGWGSGVNYVWTPNTNITNTTIANPEVNPLVSTTYSVTASIASCLVTDSVHIGILPSNTVDLQPTDTAACVGDLLTLTANPGLTNYQWINPNGSTTNGQNNNVSTSGFYYFTFDGSNGCPGISDSVLVSFIPLPTAILNGGQNPVDKCAGDSILLFSNILANQSYQWQGNAQAGSTYNVTTPGTYTLNVTSTILSTCASQFNILVVDNQNPVVNLVGLPDVLCCDATDSILFMPYSLPNVSANDSVFWDGQYVSGDIAITSPGTYNLEIVTSAGCNSLGSYVVNRYCLDPVITAEDTLTMNQVSTVSVSTTATPGNGPDYLWSPSTVFDFIDVQSPAFRSDVFGDNTISVEVSSVYSFGNGDSKTCVELASEVIYVTDQGSIQMPNAFTPNNDGVNDTYGPVITGNIDVISFLIYNRWGDLVYRHNDLNPTWDGTNQGVLQAQDFYVYYISVRLPDGTVEVYTGNLTLIY